MVSVQQIAFHAFLFCCFLAVFAKNCDKFTLPHAEVAYELPGGGLEHGGSGGVADTTVAWITCHQQRRQVPALPKPAHVTCTNGVWIGHKPKCPKKPCVAPVGGCCDLMFNPGYETLAYASGTTNHRPDGSTVAVSCTVVSCGHINSPVDIVLKNGTDIKITTNTQLACINSEWMYQGGAVDYLF